MIQRGMNTGRLIYEQPKPRILVAGVLPDDPFVAGLRRLAPTVRVLRAGIWEVRGEEWDALICVGAPQYSPAHLYLLTVPPSGHIEDLREDSVNGQRIRIASEVGHICTYIRDPAGLGLDEELHRLILEKLIPIVGQRATHQHFAARQLNAYNQPVGERLTRPILSPFLETDSGVALAASYRRGLGGGQAWLLPEDVGDLLPWVAAALRAWKRQDLQRFPTAPGWETEPAWQTPDEQAVLVRLSGLKERRANALRELEQEEETLANQLEAAADRANREDRAVLTTRARSLVEVVARFLRELGFEVEDVDEQRPEGDLLEDLRVRANEDPNWIALVEVRAYGGGARARDFQRIGRFALRFALEHGVPPAARWYIVSQFVGQDPAIRPSPFSTNQEDLSTFAGDDGLVVDTSALFQLVMSVRSGQLDAQAARALLISQRGAFELND
jgi:hypothetical protein